MPYFITIQYPYQYLEITISDNKTILKTEIISKIAAVSLLLPTLQQMFIALNLSLDTIACIGINVGPGPFNTLRSIIATANGISFAKKIPLVACNGLQLLLDECRTDYSVVIMDAFGADVYFATNFNQLQGYDSIKNLVDKLNSTGQQTIHFFGNGIAKHKELIQNSFSGQPIFHDDIAFASMQSLLNYTVDSFTSGKTESEIFPLYFSSPVCK